MLSQDIPFGLFCGSFQFVPQFSVVPPAFFSVDIPVLVWKTRTRDKWLSLAGTKFWFPGCSSCCLVTILIELVEDGIKQFHT